MSKSSPRVVSILVDDPPTSWQRAKIESLLRAGWSFSKKSNGVVTLCLRTSNGVDSAVENSPRGQSNLLKQPSGSAPSEANGLKSFALSKADVATKDDDSAIVDEYGSSPEWTIRGHRIASNIGGAIGGRKGRVLIGTMSWGVLRLIHRVKSGRWDDETSATLYKGDALATLGRASMFVLMLVAIAIVIFGIMFLLVLLYLSCNT